MPVNREKLQSELLDELFEAKKKVERLEAAISQNAAFLGSGIEKERPINSIAPNVRSVHDMLRYLELVESEEDMSDYLGSEDDPTSKPGIGPTPLDILLPQKAPLVNPFVYQVAAVHPDDMISFGTHQSHEGDAATKDTKGLSPHIMQSVIQTNMLPESVLSLAPPKVIIEPETELTSKDKPDGSVATEATLPLIGAGEKKRHEALLESLPQEHAVRALLSIEANDEGVFDWQIEKGRVYISPRWKEILGEKMSLSSPVESMTRNFEAVESIPLWQKFDALFAGTIDRFSVTVRIRRIQGSWGWGRLNVICLRDAELLPYRMLATLAETSLQSDPISSVECIQEFEGSGLDGASDVVCRVDRNYVVLSISPSIRRYLPVTPEEAIGKHVDIFGLGEGTTFIVEHVRRVFDTGQPLHGQIPFKSPLVGQFQADCQFWPDFDDNGNIISVTTHMRDLTFAQQVADSYQSLFTGMVDGFALFEHIPRAESKGSYDASEFALVAMNPAFGKLLVMNKPHPIGYRLSDLMGKDAQIWVEKCLRRVFEEGSTVFSSLKSESRGMYFEISSYMPEPRKIACIVKNTTELHKIMQEVRLNESRFAALYRLSHMDAAPEEEVVQFSLDQAVQLTGSHHGFLYIEHGRGNDAESTYWSREVKELYEDGVLPSVPEVFRRTKTANSTKDESLRRATIVNASALETPLAFGEGLPVHSYMVSPVIEDGRVVCIAGVANKGQDYTPSDLRQLELFINGMWFQLRRRWSVQDLQKAKKEAEAASRAKNEFLANVSHELRTPLNGILGMLQLLQQSPLTAMQLDYVSTANYSGRSLLRIISDILDFSRMEAGRFVLEPQVFDFSATVRATLGMFIHQAEQKKIRFTLRIANNIPKLLLGDDSRVRQIIFNLVGNSFKFTETGTITVECALLPRCAKGKVCIYFSVQDTGIGIPDDSLDNIFKAFNQVDGSSTRKYAGTGLGLGIVQRLMHLMQGSLSIESVEGEGTTIHCCLPFYPVPESYVPEEKTPEVSPQSAPLDILVAEDDAINRLTIRSLLQKTGNKVVCVNDGRQAIEALLLHNFDCLITDIQMPNMDGVEVVSRIRDANTSDIEPSAFVLEQLKLTPQEAIIRSIPTDIPVVALTAHAMTGDKDHFLGLGMDYYLSKPILVTELNEVLSNVSLILQSRGK